MPNTETLTTNITKLTPTFDYDSVTIHLKNGTSFQLIMSGELPDIIHHLTTSSTNHRIPDGYNIVDTFTGCRIIYRVDEISYIEFKPDNEENSPLVFTIA